MTNRFDRALPKILAHEGGYVDHPADPGGATNMGITHRTYAAWRKTQGLPNADVRDITDREVAAIYRRDYWDKVSAEDLPSGIAYCVFDAAVNSGPGRAAKWLQAAVGARQDGAIGPITLAAVMDADDSVTINRMCDARMAFLKRLRHWPTFKNGWTRRVKEVRSQALLWVQDETRQAAPVKPVAGKADGEPGGLLAALIRLLITLLGGANAA